MALLILFVLIVDFPASERTGDIWPGYSAFQSGNYTAVYERNNGLINTKSMNDIDKNRAQRAIYIEDTLQTVWLPLQAGGIESPGQLIYNPLNGKIYIIGGGRFYPNIAVCDAQTGGLISMISTTWSPAAFAYSTIGNKLYCINDDSAALKVIDCQNDQVIATIPMGFSGYAIVWDSQDNKVFCLQGDNTINVIDCVHDSIIGSIPVSSNSSNLFYNPQSNKLYCSALGHVCVIDAASHAVLQDIPISGGYGFLVRNSLNNKIYCVNQNGDNVAVIDGAGDSLIATVPLGSFPVCAAYNKAADCVYVGHVVNKDIQILDGTTNQIIGSIPFNAAVCAMAYDSIDNRLFAVSQPEVMDGFYADLIVLDGLTHAIIDSFKTGVLPCFRTSILWEGSYNQVWVCNSGFDNLPGCTIDGYDAGSIAHRFKTPVGFSPFSAVINPNTGKYYCAGRSDNYIAVLNTNNPDACTLIEVGECPWDILYNPASGQIYCANCSGHDIAVLDGATDSIITRISINGEPHALALNQADNKMYASSTDDPQSGYISVIDGNSNVLLDTIAVPVYPHSLLWNPIDDKLYAASYWGMAITILDAHADTVVATIPTTAEPWSLVHNTLNDKIYCSFGSDVAVIDGVLNTVIDILGIGHTTFASAYNPADNKIYCAGGSVISVIDGVSDSIISTIVPGGNPYSLLYNPMTNTIFCAYLTGPYPLRDAVAVIDGESNEILANFVIDSRNWACGIFGGICTPPPEALVLDAAHNEVYLNHYVSSKISIIDGTTGIADQRQAKGQTCDNHLRVWPCPAFDRVNIGFSEEMPNEGELKIYDICGKLAWSAAVKNPAHVDLSWNGHDLAGNSSPAGIYFIVYQTNNYSETKKIVFLK